MRVWPLGRKKAVTLAAALVLAAAGWLIAGPSGATASLPISLLVAAWRHDNDLGTCFPLAMLFLLVMIIMVLLIGMLGMFGARH